MLTSTSIRTVGQFIRIIGLLSFLLFISDSAVDVPELTADNFATRIKEYEFVLVMFYAPWCGHCKKLKPDFESAYKEITESRQNVLLAKVDCTVHNSLCSDHGVTGYPTLKFFSNGVLSGSYEGERNKAAIVKYVLKRSKKSALLSSSAELQQLLQSSDSLEQPTLVSYVASTDDPAFDVHRKLVSEMVEDCVFAYTHDSSVLGLPDKKSAMLLFRPGNFKYVLESAKVQYSGEYSSSKIKDWILESGQGLVGYRTAHNLNYFPKNNLLVFYHNASVGNYPTGVNYYRNRLIKTIIDHGLTASGLTFAYSYNGDFYHELTDLRHDTSQDFPFIAIFSGDLKYKLDVYSRDAFIEFVEKFQNKSLTPFIVSEEVPTKQEGAVAKVVALNFDTIVNDPEKDVFIMFHAPWCGHCKQLMPKFVAAAERLSNEPGILFATFDATANDVPKPYVINGYPTLYFSPKSAKSSPYLYEGTRETDPLVEYVAKVATEELRGYNRDGKAKKTEL
ncbi:unnamed protein product [Dicrocoelium dendriticum]|nr:unnamed protein product [Dicrocoelium dendriticum]